MTPIQKLDIVMDLIGEGMIDKDEALALLADKPGVSDAYTKYQDAMAAQSYSVIADDPLNRLTLVGKELMCCAGSRVDVDQKKWHVYCPKCNRKYDPDKIMARFGGRLS